ncbi:hypothetical protein EU528_01865 [Candidatus Thorarchaeota archaeon]|nr:MAG: hypothetical protein EU528_01865 [Candidatus Thorarchaeota archaeon]
MITTPSPLYWLIEIETYDFTVGAFKGADLSGKALILSSQLWSIIRGTQVYSILIGPGIFKGVARKGGIQVDVLEFISCLMFDPTQLRFDEPLPQVDIVSPEVIDPLGTRKLEEIVTSIRNLVMERGNVLTGDAIATIKADTTVPQTIHYEEMFKRINVSHVSGAQRAKFILGGANGSVYRPFAENFPKLVRQQIERTKVLATPFYKFTGFSDIEIMTDWMIVEKASQDSKTGMEAIAAEYERTLNVIDKDRDNYIFQL